MTDRDATMSWPAPDKDPFGDRISVVQDSPRADRDPQRYPSRPWRLHDPETCRLCLLGLQRTAETVERVRDPADTDRRHEESQGPWPEGGHVCLECWQRWPCDATRLAETLTETRTALATLYWNVTDEKGARFTPMPAVLRVAKEALERPR